MQINENEAPYHPFFVALKSIMVQSLYSDGKPDTRFCWRRSSLTDPAFVYTAKSAFPQKILRSKILCCWLKLIEGESSKLRSNYQFLRCFGSGQSTFCVTSSWRQSTWSYCMVVDCVICRLAIFWLKKKDNTLYHQMNFKKTSSPLLKQNHFIISHQKQKSLSQPSFEPCQCLHAQGQGFKVCWWWRWNLMMIHVFDEL